MEHLNQTLIYFSPTRTTQKILEAVGEGTGAEGTKTIDLTPPDAVKNGIKAAEEELAIIGAPVYGGRIAIDAVRRLEKVRGDGTPAAVIVVYGNREYEDALLELTDIAVNAGFVPFAAAAFIGEHSLATSEKPIALGRPDTNDLEFARSFGAKLREKLNTPSIQPMPSIPGNVPYKERKSGRPISPETVEAICTVCGSCADVCPTAAISVSSKVITNKQMCIRCCACVKSCPTGAREVQDPDIKKVADWLYANYSARKEPEIFV